MYKRQGQRIALQGWLQSRSYTDRDGNKRTVYEVVAENAFFAESKKADEMHTQMASGFSTAKNIDFEDITSDDDLPF